RAAFAILGSGQRPSRAGSRADHRAPSGDAAMKSPDLMPAPRVVRRHLPVALVLAVLAASGCGLNGDRKEPASANTSATAPAAGTPAGVGPIELQPLEQADLEAPGLDGELACAFIDGGQTLLLARGNAHSDQHARGRVRAGD